LTLGAIAKQCGHKVAVKHQIIDRIDNSDLEGIDLGGITCNTFQVKEARNLVKWIRENSEAKIVIGGPHAIAWKPEVDGQVDQIVVGEGENAWLKILGETKQYQNIDDIPLPDYSLADMSRFCGVAPMGAVPSMVLFGSRGCPGKCIFCNTPIFWGNKARYRSPKSIVNQIQYLNLKYGIQEVFIQDDTFNANWPWAQEIFQRIISSKLNEKMTFRIDCRANDSMMTEQFVSLAAKANVWNVFLGIESASPVILKKIKKHITVDEYRKAISLIQQHGMKVQASFIIGLPGESRETLVETQRFIDETHPFMVGAGFATPFPGTEYDRWVTEKGYKKPVDYADYLYGQCLVRTDALDFDELESFKGFTNMQVTKLS
jgi:radical SAM superfamily enzyme YgiQ (UPF0313 family)